jgi:hypothetical protein
LTLLDFDDKPAAFDCFNRRLFAALPLPIFRSIAFQDAPMKRL